MEVANFKSSDDIWKVFRDYDRKDWLNILEPFIYKEDGNTGSLIYNDLDEKNPNEVSICGFTRKTLSPNFECDFNLGDFVIYNGEICIVLKLPPLDIRTANSYIKSHPMDVCYNGSCVILARPISGSESLMDISFEECTKLSENLVEDSMKQFRDKLFCD